MAVQRWWEAEEGSSAASPRRAGTATTERVPVQDPARHAQPAFGLAAELKEKVQKSMWLPPKIDVLAVSNDIDEFHLR